MGIPIVIIFIKKPCTYSIIIYIVIATAYLWLQLLSVWRDGPYLKWIRGFKPVDFSQDPRMVAALPASRKQSSRNVIGYHSMSSIAMAGLPISVVPPAVLLHSGPRHSDVLQWDLGRVVSLSEG